MNKNVESESYQIFKRYKPNLGIEKTINQAIFDIIRKPIITPWEEMSSLSKGLYSLGLGIIDQTSLNNYTLAISIPFIMSHFNTLLEINDLKKQQEVINFYEDKIKEIIPIYQKKSLKNTDFSKLKQEVLTEKAKKNSFIMSLGYGLGRGLVMLYQNKEHISHLVSYIHF